MRPLRVLLFYPVLGAGGCEKRLAELGRWLLDNGDEAWIIASSIASDVTANVIAGQCGFPWDRILLKPQDDDTMLEDFVADTALALRADVLDCQWVEPLPNPFPCPAVYTTHGLTQPLPERLDFAAHISVDTLPLDSHNRTYAPVVRTVWNWVNLDRFPFREALGRGAAFFGRSFKLWPNVVALAEMRGEQIDAYGFVAGTLDGLPPNIIWRGFTDTAEKVYQYRVVFASAQAALEAIAAGRLVVCGHWQGNFVSEATLVMPDNIAALSQRQMWFESLAWSDGEPATARLLQQFDLAMANDFPEERRQMRAYIEEHHDMRKQCRKIRETYEAVAQ